MQKQVPLLFPLSSFLLGIVTQEFFYSHLFLLFIIIIINLLFLLKNKKTLLAYTLLFYSGAFLLQHQKNINSNLFNKIKNKNITISAIVLNKEIINKGNIKEKIKLKVYSIKEKKQIEKINFKLLCYIYQSTQIRPYQKIKIKNLNIVTKTNRSFKYLLLREGITATAFMQKLNYKIICKNSKSIKQKIYQIKSFLYKSIKQKLSKRSLKYFSSIFLGNKNEYLKTKHKNKFNTWGISHYLARSGLHIIIFIIIWKLILSITPITLQIKNLLLLIILLSYLILSWPSLSFFRAFFIFLLLQLGKLFNKQTNFLHLLIIVCFIITITNPIQIFFLDFQLTFGLTFGLSLNNTINVKKRIP